MLDWTNVRKTTEQMLVMSRAYTEKFWQEVFNLFDEVDEEYIERDGLTFEDPDADFFPEDERYIFTSLKFAVNRDCFGKITVVFVERGYKHHDEIGFRLSADCLLNNHFTRVDENTFVLQSVLEAN